MDRDKAPHSKAMSGCPHCERILSSALTEPPGSPTEEGNHWNRDPPLARHKLFKLSPTNKMPDAMGLRQPPASGQESIPYAKRKIPRFLPLCAPKSVPTPQMRQSKVWEHSPEIGVRHIHFLLSSIHCESEAMGSKRRWGEKNKGGVVGENPNYQLPPEKTCGELWSQEPLWACLRSPRPVLALINAQPSERFRKLISSCVCLLLGSLGQL